MNEMYRLTIEMVPQTSWYDNLRKRLPKADWDRLRKKVYAQYNYRCAICQTEGRLHCHELWLYDDEQHIQRLVGFVALCPLCHFVKHLGFATSMAEEGRLDFERVVRHFMRVNRCSRSDFEARRDEAFQQWHTRSQSPWQVNIDYYDLLVAGKR